MQATETISNLPNASSDVGSAYDKHCVFRSGASWFSVPAVAVREIAIMPDLVRVPSCPSSLDGICHLRSEFIPVVSIHSLLEHHEDDDTTGHEKLVVLPCGSGLGSWALRIAEAASLVSLETLGTSECPTTAASQTSIVATAMYRDQIVLVLDPNSLYREVRIALEDFWNDAKKPVLSSVDRDSFRPNLGIER
ncbi:CheW-like domain protein [Rubripirellula lacrimiformis]|uniref:CheW-like domain protein n=1 Tax=Rubripirellula lacrimiformis TaxID=1930273 RepID=A0A517NJ59_9BACT|nr:chemotaxis protein CheW [Rubripirellula lacrimiformis]QDT07169.1 CheW-like domain protein [Rubripirellula lacrimiformis]